MPYYPFGPIYTFGLFNNNIILNNIEKQNTIQYDNIKTEKSKDIYQETNSMSHLSTTSEGEPAISVNYNNYYIYQSFPEKGTINKKNKNENKNKKRDLCESITIGIKDISDCINSNKTNIISFDCYYFCEINMNEEEEYFFIDKIKNVINDYKNNNKNIKDK